MSRGMILRAAAALVVLPLAAHLAFSWIGFNPTDDGWVLAMSRRILDGEVPHRDFLLDRPALSPLLHAPVVLLGGESTFWLSRGVVCFEWALLAFALTRALAPLAGT